MNTDRDPAAGPAADYDARAALADAEIYRRSVADRLITPWWYHPVLGLCVAAIVLVNALDLHIAVKIVVPLVAAMSMGLLVSAYQRITGLWVGPKDQGRTSRRWWLAYVVVLVVVVGAALLPTLTDRALPTVVALAITLIALLATVVLGRRMDAAMRAEIRSGDVTPPTGTA